MNTATLPMQAPGQAVSLRAPGPRSQTFRPKARYGPTGLAIMVAAHILLGYGLANGLAGKALEIIKKPLEATIVQEVKLPPPPPPPPPKLEKVKEVPRDAPPPPAYVPPPDVAPPQSTAPVITAVQSSQPVAPPPPAPAPPPPAPAVPQKADIALACPKQARPEIPERAIDEGISGTVKAELHIQGGRVTKVVIVSGPKVFHAAVRQAASRYECSGSDAEIVASQEFTFKVD